MSFVLEDCFYSKFGPAKEAGKKPCQKKLCFISSDETQLAEILLEISKRPDCYSVKYSNKARKGVYGGRCFLDNPKAVGELWAEYKAHPHLICHVQDDDFLKPYRDQIKIWS